MSAFLVVRVTLRAQSASGHPATFSTTIVLSREAWLRGQHRAEAERRAGIVGYRGPFVHESERVVRGALEMDGPRGPKVHRMLRRRGLH